MAAIITEKYRKTLAKLLINNLADTTNSYYIGIGKSDEWYEDLSGGLTAPFPQGTTGDCVNVQSALTDLIKVSSSDNSIVMPNVNPRIDDYVYKTFDPYDAACLYPSDGIKPAYFIEPTNGNVFIVLDSPGTPLNVDSIADPNLDSFLLNGNTGTGNVQIKESQGYTLACVGTINPNSRFNNSQFVQVITTLQTGDNPYKGVVYGLHIANGGLYKDSLGNNVTASNVTGIAKVYGTNQNDVTYSTSLDIDVTCSIVNGKITSIKPTSTYYTNLADNASSIIDFRFKKAIVELVITSSGIISNAAATLYPCISNINGFKYDMSEYTPSWYTCFIANSDVSTHAVYTDYSQVSLIRNPILKESTQVLNNSSKDMKNSFKLVGFSTAVDSTYAIVQKNAGQIVGRIGIVDSYEQVDSDGVVYYTPSAKYGHSIPLTTSGNTISFVKISTGITTDTSIVPTQLNAPVINSADVLFIDNRATITRSEGQNEELKIIIQL